MKSKNQALKLKQNYLLLKNPKPDRSASKQAVSQTGRKGELRKSSRSGLRLKLQQQQTRYLLAKPI